MTEQERALIDLARLMRSAGRAYYAHRKPEDMKEAMRLERAFDKALADYDSGRILAVQGSLLGETI